MNDLFIIVGQSLQEICWAEKDVEGNIRASCGGLEYAPVKNARRIIVLIANSDILLTRTTIPPGSRKLALKAIPYTLEENLAQDVELMHFAVGRKREDGTVTAAVVEDAIMADWLAQFDDLGIVPDYVAPAVLSLPYDGSSCSMLVDEGNSLIRWGPQQGMAIEVEDAPAMFAAIAEEMEGGKIQAVNLYNCSGEQLPPLDEDITFHEMDTNRGRLSPLPPAGKAAWFLASGFDENESINMLQGKYSRQAEWGKVWNKWKIPVVLLALLLLGRTGFLVSEFYSLKAEKQQLTAEIESVYKKAFPSAQKIVKPRVQMENRLKQMQSTDTGGKGAFLEIYDRAAPILAATEGFQLLTFRYGKQRLELELRVDDLQVLDGLEKKLTEIPDVAVEIRNASSAKDYVQARMQITVKQ